MALKVLQVIGTAYRGTLEEQDDTVVWITHAMKGVGADLHVLLRGAAVNYAVKGQDASGLIFGDRKQTQPPRIEEDVGKLISKGVDVYLVQEDLADRGVETSEVIAGVKLLQRASIPKLFENYAMVWNW